MENFLYVLKIQIRGIQIWVEVIYKGDVIGTLVL